MTQATLASRRAFIFIGAAALALAAASSASASNRTDPVSEPMTDECFNKFQSALAATMPLTPEAVEAMKADFENEIALAAAQHEHTQVKDHLRSNSDP